MHRKIGGHLEQATPLTWDILIQLLQYCVSDTKGHRDRVLLLLGYETMRLRAELCNLKFKHLTQITALGHASRLKRSKTDQEGASKLVTISAPLHSLIIEWQDKYELEGFILRSVDRHGDVGDKTNSGSDSAILNNPKAIQ